MLNSCRPISPLRGPHEGVAQAAIKALDGMSGDGRLIVVNLARPRETSRDAKGYGMDGFKAITRADVGYGNGEARAVVVTDTDPCPHFHQGPRNSLCN